MEDGSGSWLLLLLLLSSLLRAEIGRFIQHSRRASTQRLRLLLLHNIAQSIDRSIPQHHTPYDLRHTSSLPHSSQQSAVTAASVVAARWSTTCM